MSRFLYVVRESQTLANNLNENLERIHYWAFRWKKYADPTKQA